MFKSAVFYLATERRTYATAVKHLNLAESCLGQANEREQMLYHAIKIMVDGDWQAASLALDQLLMVYPRDIFAIQVAHVLDFFCGDALNLRNRPARTLPAWNEDVPGYSYLLGMHAFGLEESNQYPEAEATGRRALDMNPVDPWTIHAITHVLEMQNRTEEGINFLEHRYVDWAGTNNFAYHNWWHLGLMYLEQGDVEQVLKLLDEKIFADVFDALVLLDVTAMLWRLHLLNIDVTERFARLSERWLKKQGEVGFYAFNDYHAALSYAATNDTHALNDMVERLSHLAQDPEPVPNANQAMTAKVGLPLIQATAAYASADYSTATQLMLQVRDQAHLFGGSHAQRDIINLTLLSAAARTQETALCQYLLNERVMLKPTATLGQRVYEANA